MGDVTADLNDTATVEHAPFSGDGGALDVKYVCWNLCTRGCGGQAVAQGGGLAPLLCYVSFTCSTSA